MAGVIKIEFATATILGTAAIVPVTTATALPRTAATAVVLLAAAVSAIRAATATAAATVIASVTGFTATATATTAVLAAAAIANDTATTAIQRKQVLQAIGYILQKTSETGITATAIRIPAATRLHGTTTHSKPSHV